MKDSKSKARGRSYWETHVRAYRESGLSQKEYCRQNNISYWSFNPWKRRLDTAGKGFQEVSPEIVENLQVDKEKIEIIVSDSVKVSVPSQFSEESLIKVLRVLGAVR